VRVPRLGRLRRHVAEGRSDAPDPVVDVLGRIGLVGYGVVHLLVAWLALQVAMGVPEVSRPAARGRARRRLRALGDTGPGTALLIVVALGFAVYGVYCAVDAVVDAATRRA
jgi:Domain of Unknown Function (DUF1206)